MSVRWQTLEPVPSIEWLQKKKAPKWAIAEADNPSFDRDFQTVKNGTGWLGYIVLNNLGVSGKRPDIPQGSYRLSLNRIPQIGKRPKWHVTLDEIEFDVGWPAQDQMNLFEKFSNCIPWCAIVTKTRYTLVFIAPSIEIIEGFPYHTKDKENRGFDIEALGDPFHAGWDMEDQNIISNVQPRYQASLKASDLPSSYTVVDLETTGIDTKRDSIIEISALRVRDGIQSETFSTLVSCNGPIPKTASRVNGITDDMLKGAPRISDAIRSFVDFAGSDILIGHNANRFDRIFVEMETSRLPDISIENEWIDTLELAKMLYPGESVSLSALCSKFGVKNEQAHRALSDCFATDACYRNLKDKALQAETGAR